VKATPAVVVSHKPTPSHNESSTPAPSNVAKRPKTTASSGGDPKKPFCRIKDEDWDLVKPELADNRFEANFVEYGAKAHEILSQVRGRGFRHEKNKKKNSYRGGTINSNDVKSIKFSD
jgi:hypothetical protein